MNGLAERFSALSPRVNPRPTPFASLAINAGAMALFILVLAQAFGVEGLGQWSVGIVYILYDTALLGFTAIQIRTADRNVATAMSGGQVPSVGVVIAAYNEARSLGPTIDRLMAQAPPPDRIVIADDGSSDDTPAALNALFGLTAPTIGATSAPAPALPCLTWLRLPRGGKARALNAAIGTLDTDLVLTVDADTLLQPGALMAMRRAFTDESALVAATGILVPICGDDAKGRLFQWFQRYEYVRNFLSRRAWMRLDSLLLISGAFAGFRREPLMTVGGFDPHCLVEDYELIHRLYRHARDQGLDWRVRVVGGAVATTDAPATVMGFLRQRRRWFGGFLQTQYWNRDMVGSRRYGWLGTAMLPVKALDTLQPLYGIAAFAILLALAAAGRFAIALPILYIMLAKVTVDLAFHLWSLGRYRRWTGIGEGLSAGPALIASLLEPFTFQILRHIGASWGWLAFLTGRSTWARSQRSAVIGDPS